MSVEQYIRKAKTLALNGSEKLEMRNAILLKMAQYPVRNREGLRHVWQRSIQWIVDQFIPNKQFNFKLKPMPVLLAISLLVGAMGGGVSMAAEGSLPGDMLHPVKIVNENLRSAFAFSPEAKAHVEVERMSRRLQEVESLTVKGQLVKAEDNVARIEDSFGRMQEHVNKIEDNSPEKAARVAGDFEAMLLAHKQVLDGIEVEIEIESEDEGLVLRRFVDTVGIRLENARRDRDRFEDRVLSSSSDKREAAKNVLGVAEDTIARVGDFLSSRGERAGENTIARAETRLDLAKKLLDEAKAELERDPESSFILSQDVIVLSNEARRLINGSVRTGVDVSSRGGSRSTMGDVEIRDDRVRLRTLLIGAAIDGVIPSGHAKFEVREDRTKFNVEIERVNLPENTSLDVVVDGVKAGSIVLSGAGRSEIGQELELDSRRGETVPSIEGGEKVEVKKSDGAVILSGTFSEGLIPSPLNGDDDEDDDVIDNSGPGSVNSGPGSVNSGRDDDDERGSRGREVELRGRDNEPGEDVRGNADENEVRGRDNEIEAPGDQPRQEDRSIELRGRDNEPGEDVRGNADENEVRGRDNEIEAPGDQPRQEDRRDDSSGGGSSGSGGSSSDDSSSGGTSGGGSNDD